MTYPNFVYHELETVFEKLGEENCLIDRCTALFLYTMVCSLRPRYILEIGRYKGFSTACLSGAIMDSNLEESMLYSLDIKNQHPEWMEYFFRSTRIIEISSLDLLSCSELSTKKFDLIYIDGSHLYEDVLSDLQKGYALSHGGTRWIIDDYEFDDVKRAVDLWSESHTDLKDLGLYNKKIKMFSRSV